MAPCRTCYWFRFVKDHLPDVDVYADNRGCTYGWEKQQKVDLPKKVVEHTSIEVDGDRPVKGMICRMYKPIKHTKPFTSS